jgi:hypothetical protein
MGLLETGSLYVADFQSGRWLLLDYDRVEALRSAKATDGSAMFGSQADVLVNTPAAAMAVRGTPVDRPEDIEIHPLTGHVYIALTNNSNHGNFHGQIVRLVESDNNPEATSFQWELFAVGGPQSGFSSPDNLMSWGKASKVPESDPPGLAMSNLEDIAPSITRNRIALARFLLAKRWSHCGSFTRRGYATGHTSPTPAVCTGVGAHVGVCHAATAVRRRTGAGR